MDHVNWKRAVPIQYEADVAVIGGGIAGVCAACAAAEEGASVVLVERFAAVGGNATVGGVANWQGETAGQGRIFDEILAMQEEWKGIAPYPGPADNFTNSVRVFDHEVLAIILQELLSQYGVRVLLHTRFADVMREGPVLGPALIVGASGLEALRASVFIDASGDACLARAAGCEMLPRAPLGLLPPSMMFFVRELEQPAEPQVPEDWLDTIASEEQLPMTSVWPAGPKALAIKAKVIGFDTAVTEDMTALEIRARRRAWEIVDYYQRDTDGNRRAFLGYAEGKPTAAQSRHWFFDHSSPIVGLRETHRIAGDYVLTVDDLRAGRSFEDAVARGVMYLDGMRPDDEKRTYLLSREEQKVPPYHIPLRSLMARGTDNLLMAGRCFSSDQLALSSARVMPTCAMMGQAAGRAAAWTAEEGASVRAIDGRALSRHLKAKGANLDLTRPDPKAVTEAGQGS